jgi:guanylate kinase
MTMIAPDRSASQRRNALEQANIIRLGRAQWKRDTKQLTRENASSEVARILDNPPEIMGSMRVEDLLLAIPRIGTRKVDRLLFMAGISPRKRVGGLSSRQREALSAVLRRDA